MPVLKHAGKEAAMAGTKIVGEMVDGRKFSDSAKEHGKKVLGSVLRKTADHVTNENQDGSGLGKRKKRKALISYKTGKKRKLNSFNTRTLSKKVGFSTDIFGKK